MWGGLGYGAHENQTRIGETAQRTGREPKLPCRCAALFKR